MVMRNVYQLLLAKLFLTFKISPAVSQSVELEDSQLELFLTPRNEYLQLNPTSIIAEPDGRQVQLEIQLVVPAENGTLYELPAQVYDENREPLSVVAEYVGGRIQGGKDFADIEIWSEGYQDMTWRERVLIIMQEFDIDQDDAGMLAELSFGLLLPNSDTEITSSGIQVSLPPISGWYRYRISIVPTNQTQASSLEEAAPAVESIDIGIPELILSQQQIQEIQPLEINILMTGCPLGWIFNSQTGYCNQCTEQWYSLNTLRRTCAKCPDHTICPGRIELVPRDGYWHSSSISDQIHRCVNPVACTPQKSIDNTTTVESCHWETYKDCTKGEVQRSAFLNNQVKYIQCVQALLDTEVGLAGRPRFDLPSVESCERMLNNTASQVFSDMTNLTIDNISSNTTLLGDILREPLDMQCSVGYEGPLCGKCVNGTGLQGTLWGRYALFQPFNCIKCSSTLVWGLFLSALATVVVLVVTTVSTIRTNIGGRKETCRFSDVLKQVLLHVQLAVIIFHVDDVLPEGFRDFVSTLESLVQPTSVSMSCMYSNKSSVPVAIQTTIVNFVAPIPIYISAALLFSFGYKMYRMGKSQYVHQRAKREQVAFDTGRRPLPQMIVQQAPGTLSGPSPTGLQQQQQDDCTPRVMRFSSDRSQQQQSAVLNQYMPSISDRSTPVPLPPTDEAEEESSKKPPKAFQPIKRGHAEQLSEVPSELSQYTAPYSTMSTTPPQGSSYQSRDTQPGSSIAGSEAWANPTQGQGQGTAMHMLLPPLPPVAIAKHTRLATTFESQQVDSQPNQVSDTQPQAGVQPKKQGAELRIRDVGAQQDSKSQRTAGFYGQAISQMAPQQQYISYENAGTIATALDEASDLQRYSLSSWQVSGQGDTQDQSQGTGGPLGEGVVGTAEGESLTGSKPNSSGPDIAPSISQVYENISIQTGRKGRKTAKRISQRRAARAYQNVKDARGGGRYQQASSSIKVLPFTQSINPSVPSTRQTTLGTSSQQQSQSYQQSSQQQQEGEREVQQPYEAPLQMHAGIRRAGSSNLRRRMPSKGSSDDALFKLKPLHSEHLPSVESAKQKGAFLSLVHMLRLLGLNTMSLFYPILVFETLSLFSCYTLDVQPHDEVQYVFSHRYGYWIKDMAQECFTGYHKVAVTVMGVMGLLFVCLGFPALVFVVLFTKRKKLRAQHIMEKYLFLYHSYRSGRYYWEVFRYFTIFVLVAVRALFIPLSSIIQLQIIAAAMVVLFVFVVFMQPHRFWNLFVNELLIYGVHSTAAFCMSFVAIPDMNGSIPMQSMGHYAVLSIMSVMYTLTLLYLMRDLVKVPIAWLRGVTANKQSP